MEDPSLKKLEIFKYQNAISLFIETFVVTSMRNSLSDLVTII